MHSPVFPELVLIPGCGKDAAIGCSCYERGEIRVHRAGGPFLEGAALNEANPDCPISSRFVSGKGEFAVTEPAWGERTLTEHHILRTIGMDVDAIAGRCYDASGEFHIHRLRERSSWLHIQADCPSPAIPAVLFKPTAVIDMLRRTTANTGSQVESPMPVRLRVTGGEYQRVPASQYHSIAIHDETTRVEMASRDVALIINSQADSSKV